MVKSSIKIKTQYEIEVIEGNVQFSKLPTNINDEYLSISVSRNIDNDFSPFVKLTKVENTQEEINSKFWFCVGIVFGQLAKHYNYNSLKEINTTLQLTIENE